MSRNNKQIVQYSTINALLVKLYDGVFSVAEVKSAGQFGIGCSHGIDGEVMFHDGCCYVARMKKRIEAMGDEEMLPFAQVADFQPTYVEEIKNVTKASLMKKILDEVGTQNMFLGIRVEGKFKNLKVRRPPNLQTPYLAMVDLLVNQEEEEMMDVSGTLLGFWTPKAYQGLSVAGLHVHFVTDDRLVGGHVLEFEVEKAKLEYELFSGIDIRLPTTDKYLDADLTYANSDEHIRQVEG